MILNLGLFFSFNGVFIRHVWEEWGRFIKGGGYSKNQNMVIRKNSEVVVGITKSPWKKKGGSFV